MTLQGGIYCEGIQRDLGVKSDTIIQVAISQLPKLRVQADMVVSEEANAIQQDSLSPTVWDQLRLHRKALTAKQNKIKQNKNKTKKTKERNA